jgi:conjugative transfer pilus assembly protein TraH
MTHRILACSIWLSVMVGGPAVAMADINTSLQTMFNGWGTASATRPGAYNSQAQGSLMGGSLSMRVPNQTFNLVSVAPPRFKAGCQGIDLYLGSISFPSLSRFTDLLQQMGTAGVAGFAFQLALMELCQPCENIISKLEAAARMINSAGRLSPCQAGQEVAKYVKSHPNLAESVANDVADTWQNVKERAGAITDVFADRDTVKNQSTADAAAALAGTPDDIRGNLVYQSLTSSGWGSDDARMIMSVLGTVIVNDTGVPSYYPPLLRLEDLVLPRPGVDSIDVYVCDEPTLCLNPTDGPDTTYEGFRTRAEAVFDSIVQKVQVTQIALSPEEQDVINRSPVPIYRLLVDYAHTPDLAQTIRNDLAEVLGVEMAYLWMEWAYKETNKQLVWMGQAHPNFTASFKEFADRAAMAIQAARTLYQARIGTITTGLDYTQKYINVMKKNPNVTKKAKESQSK